MHQKLDVLAARLGFPFQPVDCRAIEIARPQERIIRSGMVEEGVHVDSQNKAGPMQMISTLTIGSQQSAVVIPSAAVARWSSLPPGQI